MWHYKVYEQLVIWRKKLVLSYNRTYKTPCMKNDILQQFISSREFLLKEKAILEDRLAKINSALKTSDVGTIVQTASKAGRPAKLKVAGAVKAPKVKATRAKRAKNAVSLKDAMLQATAAKPLGREDILAALKKSGYKFSTDKPLNSMGVYLYNKKFFKNDGGKFGPAK